MNTKKIFISSAVCLGVSVMDVSAWILQAFEKVAELQVFAYTFDSQDQGHGAPGKVQSAR